MLSIKLGVLAIFLLLFATPILEKLDAKPGDEYTTLDNVLLLIGLAVAIGSVLLATACVAAPAERKSDSEKVPKEDRAFEIDETSEAVQRLNKRGEHTDANKSRTES